MSLLSRDRLLVSLAPDAVSWVRLAGALRRRAVGHGVIDADAMPGSATVGSVRSGGEVEGGAPWARAVAALAAQAQTWRRERVAVTIVLSNHFVRYALVEPPPRGVSADEELALARFHYTRLHGERANAWDVRVAPGKRGGLRVASAIDRALLAALQAAFARPGKARLVSVQPYLMCAFNRWRGRFDTGGAWLVLEEPGRVCVGLLKADDWRALQSARSAGDAHDWLALLEREAQRVAVKPVPATVFARSIAGIDQDAAAQGPWRLVALHAPSIDGIPDTERERYSMALHAA